MGPRTPPGTPALPFCLFAGAVQVTDVVCSSADGGRDCRPHPACTRDCRPSSGLRPRLSPLIWPAPSTVAPHPACALEVLVPQPPEFYCGAVGGKLGKNEKGFERARGACVSEPCCSPASPSAAEGYRKCSSSWVEHGGRRVPSPAVALGRKSGSGGGGRARARPGAVGLSRSLIFLSFSWLCSGGSQGSVVKSVLVLLLVYLSPPHTQHTRVHTHSAR